MFGIFKKRTPEELAIREMKRLRKKIIKEGGPEKVCFLYWKFLEDNEFYNATGVAAEEETPYSKLMAIYSSLDLLNSWKNTSDEDPQIKSIMELLSKRVYIAGHLTFNNQELLEFYESVEGKPGQFHMDPEQADEAESIFREAVKGKRERAEKAWSKWRGTEFDVFEAICNA